MACENYIKFQKTKSNSLTSQHMTSEKKRSNNSILPKKNVQKWGVEKCWLQASL